ncbi:MAG: YicC family protein [Leptospirillum sp.]
MTSSKLNSMTGFGEHSTIAPVEGYRITIKSLNHRNLEIQATLPREWDHLELAIRKLVSQSIQRGRIEISVSRIDGSSKNTGTWLPKALEAYEDLVRLQELLGMEDPVRLEHILMHLSHERAPSSSPVEMKYGLEAVSSALDLLLTSRKQEGDSLSLVIEGLLEEVQESVRHIEMKRPTAAEKARDNFINRMKDLLAEVQSHDTERRLEEEALFYLSKKDNEEEWQRFRIHLTRFRQDLAEGGPIGKSLDFLLQEMQREINTFITKESQPEVFQPAMTIRNTLTRLKEQIQNVE